MQRIFFLLIISLIAFASTALGNNAYTAQSHYDGSTYNAFEDAFEDTTPVDPIQQAQIQQQIAKEQARERLITRGIAVAAVTVTFCLLLLKGGALIELTRSLRSRLRVSRKIKAFISINLIWLLILLFTNSFQFEDVLAMSSYDWERFRLLFILPFIFFLVTFTLYTWIMQPEQDTSKTTISKQPRSINAGKTRDKRFYIRRIAILPILFLLVFTIQILAFITLKISPPARPDFMIGGFIFLLALVFSAPLGFWRKAACWLFGMMALAFSRSTLLAITIDVLTITSSTKTEKAAEAAGHAFRQTYSASLVISLVAVSIGLCVVNVVQKRWRQTHSK